VKILKGLFVVGLLLGMSGCATYTSGTTQDIKIVTSGVDNVICTLSNDDYKYIVVAPATIDVERDDKDLKLICHKAGYLDVHEKLESKVFLAKTVFGNAYNGFVPGIAYDVMSGANYNYPDMIIVSMKRDPSRYIIDREPKYVLPKKEYDLVASIDPSKVMPVKANSSFPQLSEEEQDTANAIFRSIVK